MNRDFNVIIGSICGYFKIILIGIAAQLSLVLSNNVFAGRTVDLDGGALSTCPASNPGAGRFEKQCQFKYPMEAKINIVFGGKCVAFSQEAKVTLYAEGRQETLLSHFQIHSGLSNFVDALNNAAATTVSEGHWQPSLTKDAGDNLKLRVPFPGVYHINFWVEGRGNKVIGCDGMDKNYWFEIVKPSVSNVRFSARQGNSKLVSQNGAIPVKYSDREAIVVNVDAYEDGKELNRNHLTSCKINVATDSDKTREKARYFTLGDDGKSVIVYPGYVERASSVILTGGCSFAGGGEYEDSVEIEKLTLNRGVPDFGSPRLQWGDGSVATKQFDWAEGVGSEAKNLKIKVVATNPNQQNIKWDLCDIFGTGTQGYSFSESIVTQTDNSLWVTGLGKGQAARGGQGEPGRATFSGVCYEDKTHWDYYYQRLDDITLQRGAPRIIGRGDVAGNLSFSKAQIHPGESFLVKADASLVNSYPHVKFDFSVEAKSPIPADIAACNGFGVRSNNICYVNISHPGKQSGGIELQAASKDQVKIRTSLTARVTAQNQDLNDVSDDIELDSKSIDIVPQITVRGRTSSLNVQIGNHPVNAANIVLHQGRQVDVALSDYRLIGDMPGGGENGRTSGELTALKLVLPTELEKTATPKWAIAGASPAEADGAWTGHDAATKLNSPAVRYKEDQSIKVTVPVKVTANVAKKVELHLSGQYATTEAEVLNPAGTDETAVTIAIGDKLLPANQVFWMDVNQTVPLTLIHNAPNNRNYVEVHVRALKTVSGVDLRVDLPEGLLRGVEGELQLLKNGVVYKDTVCPNSCLNNKWTGSGVIVDGLSMTQNDRFIMKIPVELATSASGALKPVEIFIEQNDGRVDQDTRERVVEWKTDNSVLKTIKPVVVKSREQVAVNKMDRTLQVVNGDGKTFQAVVDVMNADETDTVTLVSGGRSFPMTRVNVNNGPSNRVRYEATSVPMLRTADDILTVTVQSDGGNPVSETVGDGRELNRALTCSEETSTCALIWQGARVPYFHAASENALGLNLSSLGKEAWFDKSYRLSAVAEPWAPVSLFPPSTYALPRLDEGATGKTRSFMLDGTLPQEGSFHFDYEHE
ncbi:hypothetical protein E9536_40250 [Burkholderia sp. LS-044]|uniref:hypothetical protein n=1 Tax=Burkholderia sp. LS-044 TaxID=1459967 RepID=UPI0010A660F5|nr:hypothetical protein [Burkholderia sp. LS-044]THJ46023.1 hypothetical protein E9536_40250 [Burkholderia sp. LS-044]